MSYYYHKYLTSLLAFVKKSNFIVTLVSGNNSVVECNLAKVEVASSTLVSRSILLFFSVVLCSANSIYQFDISLNKIRRHSFVRWWHSQSLLFVRSFTSNQAEKWILL